MSGSKSPVRASKKRNIKKIFIIAFAVIAVTSLVGVAVWNFFVTPPPVKAVDGEEVVPADERPDGIFNILVVGRDKVGLNTDTILLASINTKQKTVNVLSIPRDTMSNVERRNKKINAAYSIGGKANIDNLLKEVKGVTGIMPDRYAIIGLEAFITLVDAVDGVEVDVAKKMHYEDPAQDLYIHIEPGLQTLYGEDAMGFVRYRSGYADADLGRIRAQQQFLVALAQKLKSPAIFTKVPTLIKTAVENVKTNLTIGELMWFATKLGDMSLEDLNTHTLPGKAGMYNKLSYFIVNEEKTLEIINTYFNPGTKIITDLNLIDVNSSTSTSTKTSSNESKTETVDNPKDKEEPQNSGEATGDQPPDEPEQSSEPESEAPVPDNSEEEPPANLGNNEEHDNS